MPSSSVYSYSLRAVKVVHLCLGAVADGHTIPDDAVRSGRVVAKATPLILRLLQLGRLRLKPRAKLAPAVIAVLALGEAAVQRQRALIDVEVDILGWAAGGVVEARRRRAGTGALGQDGVRRVDDFNVETRSKRLEVADDEGAVGGVVRSRHEGGKLLEAKRRQETHDVRVVAKVEVERLVEREGRRVVVQRDVDLGRRRVDEVVLQARQQLDDPRDADGAARGRLERVVARKVDVDAVLVADPLLVREEAAELREAQPNRLVGAERLRVVRVVDGPVPARDLRAEALRRVGEVDARPLLGGYIIVRR